MSNTAARIAGTKSRSNGWYKLRFFTPTSTPHGMFGVIQCMIGFKLMHDGFIGDLSLFENNSILLVLFWIATIMNSIGGYRMKHKAPKNIRPVFGYTSVLQVIFVYFSIRLSKFVNPVSIPDQPLLVLILAILDNILGCRYIILVAYLMVHCYKELNVAAALLFSTLYSVAGYMVFVMYYGQEYVNCLNNVWPYQLSGFVCYVYSIIILFVSISMFEITIAIRKLLPPSIIAPLIVVPVFGILIAAIFMQEIHVPFVSTQRLIIFCPRPQPNSYKDYIEYYFNVSHPVQIGLTKMGYQFHSI